MSCSVVTTDLAELAEPRQGNGHGEHVFPAEAPSPTGVTKERLITAVLILAPMLGVVVAALGIWTPRVTLLDIILATLFFVVSGHGLTAGFHRMFTHRSFKATRWLKVTLAIAGSLGVQGSLISWVANHRRHHAYTDTSGDPHSPYEYGTGVWNQIRGALHSHVGWLFLSQPTDEARWAPDLIKDRDAVVISRLFPAFVVVSLGLPMLIGWAFTQTWRGAVGGLIWGGLIRLFVLHHATYSVNSACHIWGRRPFATRDTDRSTNFAPLAVLAMGENWHNLHHSFPTLARHGVDRHQLDSTARLIQFFQWSGAAWDVRWPVAEVLDARRSQAERLEMIPEHGRKR
jgi:stearoyl-CoA desaturase (delta-9 desaturase)